MSLLAPMLQLGLYFQPNACSNPIRPISHMTLVSHSRPSVSPDSRPAPRCVTWECTPHFLQ